MGRTMVLNVRWLKLNERAFLEVMNQNRLQREVGGLFADDASCLFHNSFVFSNELANGFR